MKFGVIPLEAAEGAILAHTVRWQSGSMRKGIRLDRDRISKLRVAGVEAVMGAQEEPDDLHEDDAADRMARAVAPDPASQGLRVGPARHGRVNLFALNPGVLRVDAYAVMAFNQVSESAAISTLPRYGRVASGQLVATVKIIPFAVSRDLVERAVRTLPTRQPALEVRPVRIHSAALVTTRGEWTPDALRARGVDAVGSRLQALGIPLESTQEVPHEEESLAQALSGCGTDLILVLGDTVTSDRGDVAPRAIRRAGGRVERFGMPVDPGNLLLLGEIGGRPVIVLPGCARSPKLNGADWVLERVACGIEVGGRDFAAMGVGGLLHEIASRPSPRLGGAETPAAPRIPILLLAAGASSRMGSSHKLLRKVDGVPLAARVASRLAGSRASGIVAVVGSRGDAVADAFRMADAGPFRVLVNELHGEGIGASIRAGIAAVAAESDAVVIALADMPEIVASDIDRLIGAYDPARGSGICRLVGPEGQPGHPVLFGRRYFEALGRLSGDRGAREVLAEHPQDLVDLEVPVERLADLDTEIDWERWLAKRQTMGEQAE